MSDDKLTPSDMQDDAWLGYSQPGYGYDDDDYGYDFDDDDDYFEAYTDADIAAMYSYWDIITDSVMSSKAKVMLLKAKVVDNVTRLYSRMRWKVLKVLDKLKGEHEDPNELSF